MFPYGIIVASQMLLQKKDKTNFPPPYISTLGDYTDLTSEEFFIKLSERVDKSGLTQAIGFLSCWQNFDSLSEAKKIKFITEITDPKYYSISNRIKRLIKKIKTTIYEK